MLQLEKEENAANGSMDDLVLAIQNRNKNRADEAENFFDSLIEKYSKKASSKSTKRNASTSPAKSSSKGPRKSKKKT